MERSLKYFLSFCLIIGLFSCNSGYDYYNKSYPKEIHAAMAEELIQGIFNYYQGSAGNMNLLEEAEKYDNQNALLYREFAVPYLKRGYPIEFHQYYDKCVKLDPLHWQGWRGYLYLYFYRDYEKALADLEATDILTPDFVDYPQSTSVDFMRGICYYYLDQPYKSVEYLKRHIKLEEKTVGKSYIDSRSFVLMAMNYMKIEDYDEALLYLREAQRVDPNFSSIFYNMSLCFFELGQLDQAEEFLGQAQKSYDKGIIYNRNYVDDFCRIYQQDIDKLQQRLISNTTSL